MARLGFRAVSRGIRTDGRRFRWDTWRSNWVTVALWTSLGHLASVLIFRLIMELFFQFRPLAGTRAVSCWCPWSPPTRSPSPAQVLRRAHPGPFVSGSAIGALDLALYGLLLLIMWSLIGVVGRW